LKIRILGIVAALILLWGYFSYGQTYPFNSRFGKVILIDPGHGGIDGGTNIPEEGIFEKDINLKVALLLRENLVGKGLRVELTREEDQELGHLVQEDFSRHRRDLTARVRIAHRIKPNVFISIHVNFARDRRESGGIVYYQKNMLQSRICAHFLQQELRALQPHSRQKALPGNYFILRNSRVPAILVELGYISNSIDKELLIHEEYQKEIAAALAKGLNAYFNTTNKSFYLEGHNFSIESP
jgi:N-acetylmuramoyl-L-alanine amidase